MSESIKRIQTALKEKGFNPGVIDGVMGRNTRKAIVAFQKKHKLIADGIVGPKTEAILFAPIKKGRKTVPISVNPAQAVVPWYDEAKRYMGLKEIVGPKHNLTILSWAKRLGGWIANFYTKDEIPWCGLFMGHIFGVTLPEETLPSNPLGAKEWAKFGVPSGHRLGAVVVFTRDGGGHVGLYHGEDKTHFHILGGNQSNSVNITRIAKNRMIAIRWPSTAPKIGPDKAIWLSANGTPISKNEA